MQKISNKQESLNFIKENDLNHFGEEYFHKDDEVEVATFLNKYPVQYYFLRELIPNSPNVFNKLTKAEVLEKCHQYAVFGVDVSSVNYYDNRVLCGEIVIDTEGSMIFSGSTNKESTHRNFMEPNYFIKSTIFDYKIKSIPSLDYVIDYIFRFNLFDAIIEFCTFDIPVGIKQENIVIYEVRTHY